MEVLAFSASLRLLDADRMSRRTIADAIEVLRKQPGFLEDMRAEVRIGHLGWPSGNVAGLVQVVCVAQEWAVTLPSCTHFSGISTTGSCAQQFDIDRLDGALVDSDANVELSDGTFLHGVGVVPAPEMTFSPLERRVVAMTVRFLGAEAQCCHYPPKLQNDGRGTVETIDSLLDYSKLGDLKLPCLEAIQSYIAANDWTLRRISRQTIANALRRCGMRFPRSQHRRPSRTLPPSRLN